jgi:hypothetical protein
MNNNAKEKRLTQYWKDQIVDQEEEMGKKIIAAHKVCGQLQQEKERIENEWKGKIHASQAKHHQLVEELQARQRERIIDAQTALQETQDKKQKRTHEIEEMRRQIIAGKDKAIQQCERRFRKLQAE